MLRTSSPNGGSGGDRTEDVEERANALGAALVVPAYVFRRAIRAKGHAVHALALEFGVPPSLVLLRLGEVVGRPVALLREPEPIVRGTPFAWPRHLAPAVLMPPPGVHPIRLVDEVGERWGLLAG